MDYRYDTVVIGAGPAGMACAITMQRRGAKLCVIDKAVFPRKKTCAGLVTAKTYRLIRLLCGKDTDKLFCSTASTVKLYCKSNPLAEAQLEQPVRLVDREHFDNALVEVYKSLGGAIMEGASIILIDYDNKRIRLSNGDTLSCRTLVFADGALSRAHRLITVSRSKLAFGIEAFVPMSEAYDGSVGIYFDYLDDGYVWAFPHGDTVCIGAAGRFEKRKNYRELFDSILTDLGIDAQGAKYVGAFLPYGYVIPQEELPEDVLLIGDAGGFTDPISGEGLYMAMKTGVLAAKSLLAPHPKKHYLESVKPLQRIVKDGKKVQKTFYSPAVQKFFYHKVKNNDKAISFFFEHQVEEYGYDYRHMERLYRDYKKASKGKN